MLEQMVKIRDLLQNCFPIDTRSFVLVKQALQVAKDSIPVVEEEDQDDVPSSKTKRGLNRGRVGDNK